MPNETVDLESELCLCVVTKRHRTIHKNLNLEKNTKKTLKNVDWRAIFRSIHLLAKITFYLYIFVALSAKLFGAHMTIYY
jgi:hypothetical protein